MSFMGFSCYGGIETLSLAENNKYRNDRTSVLDFFKVISYSGKKRNKGVKTHDETVSNIMGQTGQGATPVSSPLL